MGGTRRTSNMIILIAAIINELIGVANSIIKLISGIFERESFLNASLTDKNTWIFNYNKKLQYEIKNKLNFLWCSRKVENIQVLE